MDRRLTGLDERSVLATCWLQHRAVSMLVIAGAAMLVRSLYNLEDVDLGYPRQHLIVVKTDPLSAGLTQERLRTLAAELTEALASSPGVEKAAVSVNGLFSGTESNTSIEVEGYQSKNEEDLQSDMDQIGPGYFSAIGATMLLGREFDARDNQPNANTAIVNDSFAKFYFKDGNPIGHKLLASDEQSVNTNSKSLAWFVMCTTTVCARK